eukprot:CAMPEP_0117448822 /NCGR_PEP_ID=MMETSP0759-20121206/7610_1 /TAXON_ID=63605 /ORGANISM="Percolomonas cosmopolitus, Strain WS" /LENGTH=291 /DNA_ID=CAMNT_0005241243 /DNA_START=123 /DNA_END=995 /DNA_ORIENTATION=-
MTTSTTNPITGAQSTPAYGSIPGSQPSKWAQITSKRHLPSTQQNQTLSSNWDTFYNDASYKPEVQCKKVVRQVDAGRALHEKQTVDDVSSGKRCFRQLQPVQDKRTGMKMIQRDNTATKEYKRPERRHVKPSWEGYKNESADTLVNGMGNWVCGREVRRERVSSSESSAARAGRHLVTLDDGKLAHEQRGSEVSLSDEMARRKHVNDKRNGIPEQFAKGEKPYRVVEHSDKFHDGANTKPRNRSTDVEALDPRVTLNDKQAHVKLMAPQRVREKEVKRREEVAMVKALDNW